MADRNVSEAYDAEEGQTVEIETDSGETIIATVTEYSRESSTGRDPGIWEQRVWTLIGENGETYEYGRLDGLSPTEDSDTYPNHFPVIRNPEEHRYQDPPEENILGNIAEFDFITEPTGADPNGEVDTGMS